ncbi:MAG: glycosyltransferase family 2 protein [Parcubacteria group bacterium]|jgi:glycosyltransferase involved in cell wall biosynthesis
MLELSIIIPCLNEEKTLPIVIRKALESLKRLNIDGEVIVSDNGSTDNSVSVAESLGARVVHCPQKGYGNALRCGFENAGGKFLIMGDADDSYNFEEIDEFVKYLREGYDIVMGTRLKGKIEDGAMPFLHRYLGTPVLTFVLNLFFGTKISDCNCGMRGLTKKAFEKLRLSSAGMEFASEMIIKTGILKLRIKEIPITLYRDKRDKAPHLNTWRDGWRHLKFMLLYAPNFVFIWPALTAFVIGSILLLLQIRGPFVFGDIYMDVHSMIIGLTLSIVGISVFEMGMIIKLYSHLNNYYTKDKIVTWMKKVTLEKSLVTGGIVLFLGILADAVIFVDWAKNGFHDINLSRLAIFGLYFIFMGVSFISFSFLRAVMEKE